MVLVVLLSLALGMAIRRSCKRLKTRRTSYRVRSGESCLYSIDAAKINPGYMRLDAYQVQLSNNPAEELAKVLVDSGKGAFSKCGFVSGGMVTYRVHCGTSLTRSLGSEAMEAAIKLARQVGIYSTLHL